MLSRIFKKITPAGPETTTGGIPSTPGKFDEMVVTRRSSRIASANGTPQSDVGTPTGVSTRKRSRAQGSESVEDIVAASPMASKKQRKLPMRKKDEESVKQHSHLEVIIPASKVNEGAKYEAVEEKETETQGGSQDEDAAQEDETTQAASEIANSSDEEPVAEEPVKKSADNKSKKNQKKKESKPAPESTAQPSKPKHKRFGSEEPVPETPAAVETVQEDEFEEESSDDDAPEVVGANEAAEKAQRLSREAAKAAEEYAHHYFSYVHN
jgi:U3 small nucleolar RNA-associated protein 16